MSLPLHLRCEAGGRGPQPLRRRLRLHRRPQVQRGRLQALRRQRRRRWRYGRGGETMQEATRPGSPRRRRTPPHHTPCTCRPPCSPAESMGDAGHIARIPVSAPLIGLVLSGWRRRPGWYDMKQRGGEAGEKRDMEVVKHTQHDHGPGTQQPSQAGALGRIWTLACCIRSRRRWLRCGMCMPLTPPLRDHAMTTPPGAHPVGLPRSGVRVAKASCRLSPSGTWGHGGTLSSRHADAQSMGTLGTDASG